MELSIWLSYVIACILLISPPGPTVTYLITTSMTHGRKTANSIIFGSFFGGLVCLILSFLGVGAILSASTFLYSLLRIFGVVYLLYLGVKSFFKIPEVVEEEASKVSTEAPIGFKNGFLLILLNPKNIMFFAMFLPQFINENNSFIFQIIVLGSTYLIIGLITDLLYSFFAGNIRHLLGHHSDKWIYRVGGIFMIVSAVIVLFQKF